MLRCFYSITTFIREITPLLQIRQFAQLRSASCSRLDEGDDAETPQMIRELKHTLAPLPHNWLPRGEGPGSAHSQNGLYDSVIDVLWAYDIAGWLSHLCW